jgi:hypothetical protein
MAPKNKQSDSEKLTRIALVSDDKVSSSERSGPFAPADNWFYHSASRRNGKSTCHPSSRWASCVSRLVPTTRRPSCQRNCVSVVVSVSKSESRILHRCNQQQLTSICNTGVPSRPSASSTCRQIWNLTSPIDTLPTPSSCIVYPCPVRVRSSVSSERTVSERVQR